MLICYITLSINICFKHVNEEEEEEEEETNRVLLNVMLPTEATPVAVPVQKISSASFSSSTGTFRSSTCPITHFSKFPWSIYI